MAQNWMSLLCCMVIFSLGYNIYPTEGSKILVALPFSATSHNNVITALTKELAARGHTLKIITSYPIKNPPKNYSQIDTTDVLSKHFKSPRVLDKSTVFNIYMLLLALSEDICKGTLAMPEVKELVKSAQSGETYDLVIISMFYSECFYGFAHIFKAPLMLVSPAGAFPITDSLVGNPALPSFVPNIFSSFSDRMTFWERSVNAFVHSFTLFFHQFMLYPRMDTVMKEGFGQSMPHVTEIANNVSLILINSHHSLLYPRPLVPNLVEVGGMHIKPPNPLPQDMKKFMDDAKDGVIYFSLGSNLKSVDLPEDTRNALLGAFSQLKQKVLWKWEDDSLSGQSPNVKLSKWWPQSDILAHPNTKLFITHGGLLSFQEAVDRGVPLIGIPFYGDQDLNMKRVTKLGVGLQLDFASLTKDTILQAINTILNDHSFQRNMKQLSAIWKDQPETSLERAVYWTEYVLRHDGAKHLRSGAMDLTWYQYYLLDVVAALGLVLLIAFLVLVLIVRCMCRVCCKKCKKPKKGTQEAKSSKQKKQ